MTNIKFNGLAASHPDKTYNLYLNDNDKVKLETLNKVSSHFQNFSLDKYIEVRYIMYRSTMYRTETDREDEVWIII